MPNANQIDSWVKTIQDRYINYLKTSFHFKDPHLRESFEKALGESDKLVKGPFAEPVQKYKKGISELELVDKFFADEGKDLYPLFKGRTLWTHQQKSIQLICEEQGNENQRNVVVATGTASGKTEIFLYSIFFSLYKQFLSGTLNEPGVRALILYPMNALANDQRQRLGKYCKRLRNGDSKFRPTFGQYIGQTPENKSDYNRNASSRGMKRLQGELVFRDEMRENPPHILLTNYSMLEYLLIRPDDSPLFDRGNGRHWQYIVLDEAHQYRGTKGMEMGMLIRRLKQRVCDGGRQEPFRCIATSATMSSGTGKDDKKAVANFAEGLFEEDFSSERVIFPELENSGNQEGIADQATKVGRYHVFARALEGVFLVQENGKDKVALNRVIPENQSMPHEIALCNECGQHYYVGKEKAGHLVEAMRDPSHDGFGVDYYLPLSRESEKHTHYFCKFCGMLSKSPLDCGCNSSIYVQKCKNHNKHPDQLEKCEVCGYQRGSLGDPVQEIVYGADGPNAVIATALHELLPENSRKILAFADGRQEAAFFAWYSEKSYQNFRDRNLILRALKAFAVDPEGLSIHDLSNRLYQQWDHFNLFQSTQSKEAKNLEVLVRAISEAVSSEKRLSLAGVGLVKWFVKLPKGFHPPNLMMEPPWNLDLAEANTLMCYLLDTMRSNLAISLSKLDTPLNWDDVSPYPQIAYCIGTPGRRRNVRQWGSKLSGPVKHFLARLLANTNLPESVKIQKSVELMKTLWDAIHSHDRNLPEAERLLVDARHDGTFQLNIAWLRLSKANEDELFECNTCAIVTSLSIRNICPRNYCPGELVQANKKSLQQNHYRSLYKSKNLPPDFKAEEHTAQIQSDEAREKQNKFKSGGIHLLSSSTTFEVGVDLGDLEVVFLRNVPPEPFNYVQRVGRAGRRKNPGLALTYCRRNPHDLYHYEDPKNRILQGSVKPPQLQLKNEKIVSRHLVAVALSAFFRANNNCERFKCVGNFIKDWKSPSALSDFKNFCRGNDELRKSLCKLVPQEISALADSLESDSWVDKIAGSDSRFAQAEDEVCEDHRSLSELMQEQIKDKKFHHAGNTQERLDTIESESTLTFLSRKAIIPKYGFPVDVVELDTHARKDRNSSQVSLQRDLSLAISEYAPGGKVVANKLEWKSHSVKMIRGKKLPVNYYTYDDARNFRQSNVSNNYPNKYMSPIFGFVTPYFDKPKEPVRRYQRLYTTRPFFHGFMDDNPNFDTKQFLGVKVRKALPGKLIILCEGKNKRGFYICKQCGSHHTEKTGSHKNSNNKNCNGTLGRFSLGYELVTDVLRLQFQHLHEEWNAYSLAYAILLGAANTLEVPSNDMDVTITSKNDLNETEVVLYDNVPGGAGLVARFEEKKIFLEMLRNAREQVSGNCGCDESCYGCLRSYRNQFAHPNLDRRTAHKFLDKILNQVD